jgi:hypothetical protein
MGVWVIKSFDCIQKYKIYFAYSRPMISPSAGRETWVMSMWVAEKRLAPYLCASILVYLFSLNSIFLHAKQEKNLVLYHCQMPHLCVVGVFRASNYTRVLNLTHMSEYVTPMIRCVSPRHAYNQTIFVRDPIVPHKIDIMPLQERKKVYTRVKFTSWVGSKRCKTRKAQGIIGLAKVVKSRMTMRG